MKLFAFQPKGHGEYSFFVAAASEDEARAAIKKYISAHIGKNDGYFIDRMNSTAWETDYYDLRILNVGEVITNDND